MYYTLLIDGVNSRTTYFSRSCDRECIVKGHWVRWRSLGHFWILPGQNLTVIGSNSIEPKVIGQNIIRWKFIEPRVIRLGESLWTMSRSLRFSQDRTWRYWANRRRVKSHCANYPMVEGYWAKGRWARWRSLNQVKVIELCQNTGYCTTIFSINWKCE